MESGCGRDILFHKWAGFARVQVSHSSVLAAAGISFPSKTAADKDKMQLENKASKPSELFEASEADKGNCKANKEMVFL